jgi:hypothetical protein
MCTNKSPVSDPHYFVELFRRSIGVPYIPPDGDNIRDNITCQILLILEWRLEYAYCTRPCTPHRQKSQAAWCNSELSDCCGYYSKSLRT